MQIYQAGIDIGAVAVKLVLLNEENQTVFRGYRCHRAHIPETLRALLNEARTITGQSLLRICLTGAGAKAMGRTLGFRFIQEEAAASTALQIYLPQADIAVELGGESTRIFYRAGREETRINGLCTAGAGFEIDEIAHLLHMNSAGLNQAAANHEYIYPLASRCGVYTKADIQPLMNAGVSLENLAASAFQSIVDQTICDLARGRAIHGCVTFLGGPLHFLPELTNRFISTLSLQPENVAHFPDPHLYAAFGAAWEASDAESIDVDGLIEKLDHVIFSDTEHGHLSPLFESYTEYAAFCQRHQGTRVKENALANYQGDCYLGIDAGSTITKLALIGIEGQLLFTSEAPNRTSQIRAAVSLIRKLNAVLPEDAHIVRSCVTGSGEGLLKTAFALDEGVVETVAHSKAVAITETEADCVLIFGGQGVKCLRLRDGKMVTAIINESCYSGSGTFLDSFAAALGYTAEDFTSLSLYAKTPAVFGAACMTQLRSRAIQAVYEGVSIADVSAGLFYSLTENALLTLGVSDPKEMGSRIVLHGGMFCNHAILRALENLLHMEIECPENMEIMGAFGAALIAREHYSGQKSTMLPMEKISAIKYLTKTEHCIRCPSNCILTIVRFSGGFRFTFGGRCAQRLGNSGKTICAPNLLEYKKRRLLNYRPLQNAPKGQIGLPRVLNITENYPFWVSFFRALDFRVVLSPYSNREIYELGVQNASPESKCYPAVLAQGHVQWLIEHGIETVFFPYITYTQGEKGRKRSDCPTMVITENHFRTKEISGRNVRIIRPIVNFSSEKTAADCLDSICHKAWGISSKKVRTAVKHAWSEQQRARTDIRAEGMRKLQEMTEKGGRGVVLDCDVCGMDSEINHGIPELIASYGLTVFTEDSIPPGSAQGYIQTPSPWDHNTNLLAATAFVAGREDLDLIHLRSYGCDLDTATDREVAKALSLKGKNCTVLQLNEINNNDMARICIRSLLEGAGIKRGQYMTSNPHSYSRAAYAKELRHSCWTILIPQLEPTYMELLSAAFQKYGYRLAEHETNSFDAIEIGRQFVSNGNCYPSLNTIGQIISAIQSKQLDTEHLAVVILQTGGCCQTKNYVDLIRHALGKIGMGYVPIFSFDPMGVDSKANFALPLPLIFDIGRAMAYGDLLLRCLYRMRPYELEKGSANTLYKTWMANCTRQLSEGSSSYNKTCHEIVHSFDSLPINELGRKPRVGIVGDILINSMPFASNLALNYPEIEGAEVVPPSLMDFLEYCLYSGDCRRESIDRVEKSSSLIDLDFIETIRAPAVTALKNSKHFDPPAPIETIKEMAQPFTPGSYQYEENWFIPGKIIELLSNGTRNIISIRPNSCCPNQDTGLKIIKALQQEYPAVNIATVDSNSNFSDNKQLKRIKKLLSTEKREKKSQK